MDEPTRQFLADAAHIRLSSDEKAQFRNELAQFVTGEMSLEEMERDPLVKSFLQEAAGISLTMDETEVYRHELTHFMTEQAVRSQVGKRHSKQMDDRSDVLGDPDKIALSKREHSAVRRELVLHMEKKRLENVQEVLPQERLTFREYMHDFWRVVVPRTAILSCAFLIVSTGAAFAAEESLPGDWLYPLKVQVFEQVRGRFIFTPAEKAQWEAARAMRRLEEAVWLAAHNELTEESWLKLHGSFVEHVVQAEKQIDILALRGDAAAAEHLSADLDSYLSAHRMVLQSIGVERQNGGIEKALEHVKNTQQGVGRRHQERLLAGDEDIKEEEKQKAAEARIHSAKAELKRATRDNGLSDSSRSAEKLKLAEEVLEEASVHFEAGLYDEAEKKARDVVQAAAEAKLLRRLPQREHAVRESQEEVIEGQTDRARVEENVSTGNTSIETTTSDPSDAVDLETSIKKEDESFSLPEDGIVENLNPQEEVDAADIEAVVPAVITEVNPEGLLP